MGLLDKLGEKIAAAVASRIRAPDVSSFGDPFALDVPWNALERVTTTNFRTARLVDDGNGKLGYTTSIQMWLAGAALAIPGTIWMAIGLLHGKPGGLFGLIPVAIGIYLIVPSTKEFDLNAQVCLVRGQQIPFRDVHALQLLEHWVSGEEGSGGYSAYQLNLVLNDRSRVNVLDHGGLAEIRGEAQRIASHLRRPLWDGPAAPQLSGEPALRQLTSAEEKPR